MTSRREDGGRSWAAVLAACLAVLQLAIGGLSPPRAAAVTFDPLQILCTHGEAAERPGTPVPVRHDHDNGCCLAGCSPGSALPAMPIAAQGAYPRVAAILAPAPPSRFDRDRRPAASPRRTRGPPGSA